MISFLKKTAALIIVSFVIVLCVDLFYKNTQNLEYHLPKNIFPKPEIAETYHFVKVGNSHSQDGIDLQLLKVQTLDLSGVAQRFETDLAVLRHYEKQIAKDAIILIPVTPISFQHTAANSRKGFQSGYYGRVSPFLIPHLNWADYIESEFLPFARIGMNIRKDVAADVQKRVSAEEGRAFDLAQNASDADLVQNAASTDALVNTFGPATPGATNPIADSSPKCVEKDLTESSYRMYEKWNHTDEFDASYFLTNRKDLEAVIDFAVSKNWKPVLVTIPISATLQDILQDDFFETNVYENLRLTDTQFTPYFDYTAHQNIAEYSCYFGNSDHLNADGAEVFTRILLDDLIAHEIIAADVTVSAEMKN